MRIRKVLKKGIREGQLLFHQLMEQPTYREENNVVRLNPEFYYVYEMIRKIYTSKTPDDDLLKEVESEKEFSSLIISAMSIGTKKSIKEEYQWPDRSSSVFEDGCEQIEVKIKPTGLLFKLIEIYPKDYMHHRINLAGREASSKYSKVRLPSALTGYFASIGLTHEIDFIDEKTDEGLYLKMGGLLTHENIENFSLHDGVRYRDPEILRNFAPWREGSELPLYSSNLVLVEKLHLVSDVAGASKLLFMLGKDLFNFHENDNPFPNINSLLVNGKIHEDDFLTKVNELDVSANIKEIVMNGSTVSELEDINNYLNKEFSFTTFQTLFLNNLFVRDNKNIQRRQDYLALPDKNYWSKYSEKTDMYDLSNFDGVSSRREIRNAERDQKSRNINIAIVNLKELIHMKGKEGIYLDFSHKNRRHTDTSRLIHCS